MTGTDAIEVGWRIYRRSGGPSGHRPFVYNANRHNVETVTGVDMIYVNEFTGSVTTVQYKRMRKEAGLWTYRYDATAECELERMAMVDKECEQLDDGLDPRLVTAPSMVKLCRNVPFVMSANPPTRCVGSQELWSSRGGRARRTPDRQVKGHGGSSR